MKHSIKLILAIAIGHFFISCVDLKGSKGEELVSETEFVPIKINDEYEMSIPSYMNKATDLNDEASLQFNNIFKETYIVVIDEPSEEVISTFRSLDMYNDSISLVQNYRNIQFQFLKEGISIDYQSEPKPLKINGLDAELVEIDGRIEDVNYDISYLFAFIEGKEKVYMAMAWTLKNRKEKYKASFEHTIKSFKLLDVQEIEEEISE